MSPPATANSTETLFGAENVRSSAATFEPAVIGRSTVPSTGCTPRISAMKPLAVPRPARIDPERPEPGPEPDTRSLAPPGVAIFSPRGDLPLVVLQLPRARPELLDGQHVEPPPRPRTRNGHFRSSPGSPTAGPSGWRRARSVSTRPGDRPPALNDGHSQSIAQESRLGCGRPLTTGLPRIKTRRRSGSEARVHLNREVLAPACRPWIPAIGILRRRDRRPTRRLNYVESQHRRDG